MKHIFNKKNKIFSKPKNKFFVAAYEGIVELAEVIKTRNIETLDLRMNPIGCDGAAAVFGNIYLINACTNLSQMFTL